MEQRFDLISLIIVDYREFDTHRGLIEILRGGHPVLYIYRRAS